MGTELEPDRRKIVTAHFGLKFSERRRQREQMIEIVERTTLPTLALVHSK
jgi:hypothetical protein